MSFSCSVYTNHQADGITPASIRIDPPDGVAPSANSIKSHPRPAPAGPGGFPPPAHRAGDLPFPNAPVRLHSGRPATRCATTGFPGTRPDTAGRSAIAWRQSPGAEPAAPSPCHRKSGIALHHHLAANYRASAAAARRSIRRHNSRRTGPIADCHLNTPSAYGPSRQGRSVRT
jgi:hypothetical protein